MSLERICSKAVVTISPDATVLEATKLMQFKHIGCLVVTEESRPIGILTDRDIVLKVVASEKKPAETAVKEIMTTNPTMVNVNRTWSRRAQTKSSLLDKERETFLIATVVRA
ncbi:MAG TPA: CBS domain-containing protein [Candidatus Binatia bacterium]|nr:CBS domain-containing protein [Candidatus Binatia bacterium]